MNSTQPSFIQQTVNLLTEESFVADLKQFFVSSWHIITVLSSVIYLLVGQVYVWGQFTSSWLSTKLQPLKVKVYNSVKPIKHPLTQFITGLLKEKDSRLTELESAYQKWNKQTTPITDNNGNPLTIQLAISNLTNQTTKSVDSQEQHLSHTNS